MRGKAVFDAAVSADCERVVRLAAAAGRDGVTRADVQERTGMAKTTALYHLRAAVAAGKLVAGFDVAPRTGQVYLASGHLAHFRAAHGLAPLPGTPARAPNLPMRGASVMAITKVGPRNAQLSAKRLAVERVLLAADGPLRAEDVAEATGLELPKARRVLATLVSEGKAKRLGGDAKGWGWQATRSLVAVAAAAAGVAPGVVPTVATVAQHRNSSQGALPTQRPERAGVALPGCVDFVAPRMSCARADAMDHLAVPSRRGAELVGHTAPMSMCSALMGGMK